MSKTPHCELCHTDEDPIVGCGCTNPVDQCSFVLKSLGAMKEHAVARQDFDFASNVRYAMDWIRKAQKETAQ